MPPLIRHQPPPSPLFLSHTNTHTNVSLQALQAGRYSVEVQETLELDLPAREGVVKLEVSGLSSGGIWFFGGRGEAVGEMLPARQGIKVAGFEPVPLCSHGICASFTPPPSINPPVCHRPATWRAAAHCWATRAWACLPRAMAAPSFGGPAPAARRSRTAGARGTSRGA